jgi:hypothetical protein
MSSERTSTDYLVDILDAIVKTEQFIQGMTFDRFVQDDKTVFALVHAFEINGYASAALRRAAIALHDDHHVAFSLLVCQEHLLPFYERLGWFPFPGRLIVEQPSGPIVFTINRPMVLPGLCPAPQEGVIDLRGFP